MHAQDAVVNDGGDGKHVEAEAEVLPQTNVVAASALVVESVHSVDALALVVASQQINVLRELDLVRKQQRDRLNGLFTAVDVFTDEQKLLVLVRVARNVKQPE